MVKSKAMTVKEYISELPAERTSDIKAVRNLIIENLPKGYIETMRYGMITYVIPIDRYPNTYNGLPLGYISLASQKNYMALYLMNVYSNKEIESDFKDRYIASGKKLDMGKSCVRFKKLDDLPLDLIGETIAMTSVDDFIGVYEESRNS
ncbi:DUF1801 domain-containing protein [Candidatus Marinimicrobia bacterium MT.SAG.4]|nr:DUF1801 domain-containing protein [Candidatus Marinimicrobia bacterium MT.SAG.4]